MPPRSDKLHSWYTNSSKIYKQFSCRGDLSDTCDTTGVPRNFVRGGQQIQLRTEDTENGDLGAVAPLVRGSGGSCNLVQEISFHTVKLS